MNGQDQIRLVSGMCWAVFLSLIYQDWSNGWNYGDCTWLWLMMKGAVTVISVILGILTLHMSVIPACRFTPARILVIQYLFDNFMTAVGIYFSRLHEDQTRNCKTSQEKFLMTLLSQRAETAYGKDNNFGSLRSVAAFREHHPVTSYPHFASYMDRIAKGEENVVIPGMPLRMSLTSGTTGERKLVLQSKKRVMLFIFKFVPIGQRILRSYFIPNFSPLLKTCYLYTHTTPSHTSGGCVLGPTTMLNLPDILYRLQYSTPPAGMRLTNEQQAVYVHLLFALRDEDIQALFAIFASTLYYAFKTLEESWPHLVTDVRGGRISDHIGLADDVKATLEKELLPDPRRADELEREFQKGFDNIVGRIWPRMNSLWGVTSGSMTVYADILRAKYTKGLPIVSMIYNSTEGLLGVLHGKGERTEYITFPGDIFYEFIPIEESQGDQPTTLLAEEVSEGALYEIVVTTMDGLYRYRMGDVVKVTGFYNTAPIIEYQYRVADVLDVSGEQTPETLIKEALHILATQRRMLLVDYTTQGCSLGAEDDSLKTGGSKGYYTVIAEFDELQHRVETEDVNLKQLLPEMTVELDAILRCLDSRFDNLRADGSISPLDLVLVGQNAFGDLRSFIADQSRVSTMQIKVPKVLRNWKFYELLKERKLT